ncbi:hypothetical protein [Brachybacterium sacelli]
MGNPEAMFSCTRSAALDLLLSSREHCAAGSSLADDCAFAVRRSAALDQL